MSSCITYVYCRRNTFSTKSQYYWLRIYGQAGRFHVYGPYEAAPVPLKIIRFCAHWQGKREAGIFEEVWDGKDDKDRSLPAGVYYCVYKDDEFTSSTKIVFVK
jgi:hypothetical protein